MTQADHPRHEEVEVLEKIVRASGTTVPVRIVRNRRLAWDEALKARGEGELVVVTGSLHLVGEIRADLAVRGRE